MDAKQANDLYSAPGDRGAEPMPAIDISGLRKDFGGPPVLCDMSLHVSSGEIFGLIGPSGSGKSTTLKLLCGQLRPSAGTIAVLGKQPSGFSAATRRRIGYMPQRFVLYPDLTVQQNVAFVAGLYGIPEWRAHDRIRSVLELVELWDVRQRPAHAASGGMRRRIALAAALVHDPDLLFADEPTANLDPILRAKLWQHFHDRSAQGQTLLITTQYIDEAEQCHRVGLMYDGALIAVGAPEMLRRRAFGGDLIDIAIERPSLRFVDIVSRATGVRSAAVPPDKPLRVVVDDAERAIPILLDALEAAGANVLSVAQYRPTFDEVFIRLIEQHDGSHPPASRLWGSRVDSE